MVESQNSVFYSRPHCLCCLLADIKGALFSCPSMLLMVGVILYVYRIKLKDVECV